MGKFSSQTITGKSDETESVGGNSADESRSDSKQPDGNTGKKFTNFIINNLPSVFKDFSGSNQNLIFLKSSLEIKTKSVYKSLACSKIFISSFEFINFKSNTSIHVNTSRRFNKLKN